MTGYTRQEAANIVNGDLINDSHFNNEYNAIQAAFAAGTGHAHDGSSGEGAPITVIGPAQDFVASGASLTPKTHNTYSLGTTSVRYTTGWFQGQVTAAGGFAGDLTGNVTGNVTGSASLNVLKAGDTMSGNLIVNGTITATQFVGPSSGVAATADAWTTARTITLGGDLTGNVSIDGSADVTLTAAVVDDSHSHDGRYYTETEADGRFLQLSGGTLTGNVILAAGNAASPSLQITGSPGAGIYAGAGNSLAIGYSGAQAALFGSNIDLSLNTRIIKTDPVFTLRKSASGESARLVGQTGTANRWQIVLGTTITESGSNAGSNFAITRYNDAGVSIDDPLTITRSTGVVNFGAAPTIGGADFRSTIGAAPTPTTSAGIGQFVALSVPISTNFSLPAGGTWAWISLVFSSGSFSSAASGVSAGGTTIAITDSVTTCGGFYWRVA